MNPRIIAENVNNIFSLPEIALRINELIDSKEATNYKLEEIILHDPSLTAKILRLANSPYFRFSRKIETVSHAISLIGYKELRNLAIATSVTQKFKDIPSHLVDMETFWFHSVTSGVISRLFATHVGIKESERFFVAGLLQGIGRLIYLSQFPAESLRILSSQDQGEIAVAKAELEILGYTHTQLSAELLRYWQLPSSIWKMIAFQLDPLNPDAPTLDSCILHVATNIAGCLEPCANQMARTSQIKPNYDIEAWNKLNIHPEIIDSIIKEADFQIIEILDILKPDATII